MSDGQGIFIIIAKVTGGLSMLGTGYMICEILRDKKKLKRTYFRLMLGMSFIEFCDGLAFFLGSWCIPEGFWAAGNAASCVFQGFLLQASIGSTLYNAFLALYYLLSIRFNWSERLIGEKIEAWMHIISLTIAYGTAIAAAALGLYMSFGDVCYIGKSPYGCKETYLHGYTTCTQGDNSSLYVMFFYTILSWSSIGFTAISMLWIWWHVRHQENRMVRYTFGSDAPSRKNSKRFAIQGALYVLVFYVSHFFATVTLYYVRSGRYDATVMTFLRIMYGLTFPLEGFLNFLVYMRPRIIKYYKKRRKTPTSRASTENTHAPVGDSGVEENKRPCSSTDFRLEEENKCEVTGGEESIRISSSGERIDQKPVTNMKEEMFDDESTQDGMVMVVEGDDADKVDSSQTTTTQQSGCAAVTVAASAATRPQSPSSHATTPDSEHHQHKLFPTLPRPAAAAATTRRARRMTTNRNSIFASLSLPVANITPNEILQDEKEQDELGEY